MSAIRKFFQKLSQSLTRAMSGRYGMDKLNSVLLWTSVAIVFVAMFLPWAMVRLICTMLAYVLMGVVLYRTFSRQTYKRYRENRRFLMLLDRVRDREHRHFECPRCHQPVRVPRGKGKIAITCPKCREKFIKKT